MRNSLKVMCGNVQIGGGAPVSIQSMTNTKTEQADKTVEQILRLEEAGCEIIRAAVPDIKSALAFEHIKSKIHIPLVADIHFDYRLAVAAIESGADKVRINPGNIGDDDRLYKVVDSAKKHDIPIRVGINSGSLEKSILEKYNGVTAEGLAESALNNINRIKKMDYDNIVVSIKSSDIQMNYDAHRILADKTDCPFHIGITESGTVNSGKTKSAAGLGALLLSGIGDTLRVSLTGDPVREVRYAKDILKACGKRQFGINFISCPTCGRTRVDLEKIAMKIEELTADKGKNITVAIMGCEVNGPGEAREADCGIAFGKDRAAVFRKGEIFATENTENAVKTLLEVIDKI
ncbi:MAG: flavodoxin-dependent (E)-4-hydroxy-3-methylbut-2-enyl-diphosphate synthase [Bacillota bacterium]|nr:flavodoxin-dependent (E)-4-hydroxy-3-methylbut-2-enyl-diphosphate synthase [Bacillota bacterium]